ncbi:MAG: hypothetical protein AAGC56_00600 [Pseudomonadota bacterium]
MGSLTTIASRTIAWSLAAAALLMQSAAWADYRKGLSLEETLVKCSAIADASERLACFEAVSAAVAPTPQTAADAAPTAAVEAADPAEDMADATAIKDAPAEPAVADPAPAAAPQASDDASYVVLRADDPVLQASNDDDEDRRVYDRPRGKTFSARVVASKKNNRGAIFFELDNGQVWRDERPKDRPVPERGFVVQMKPRLAGGYFAELPDKRGRVRTVAVREVFID